MVHACVVPNYNPAKQKIALSTFNNLISVFTDSQPYTEYIDVGQLVQLDNLLLFSYSNYELNLTASWLLWWANVTTILN